MTETDTKTQLSATPAKKPRICSKCKKPGHNSATCSGPIPMGHQILIDAAVKVPRTAINGIKPAKGIWIINRASKKTAGQIDYVKRSGVIVWLSTKYHALIESTPESLTAAGYEYVVEVPAEGKW